MSGIYKSLQPKDIRYTPYLAHKTVYVAFDGNEDSSECKVYDAEHSLKSTYNFYQQGYTNIDQGNAYYSGLFPTTTDDYYKTAIHAQLDHLFFRNYLSNNKATLGGGAPINLQFRDLGFKAKVISFPTKKVGEGILPESIQITGSSYKLSDDGYGNIIFAQGTDAADYDNIMYSNTFNKYYRYVQEGEIDNQKEVITYGGYNLITDYYNVSYQTSSDATTVEAVFDAARYSRIKLSAPTTELRSIYNMYNRDYAIAFRLTPTATPASSKVILAKQDQMDDYAVDLNGDVFVSQNVPTQYPYKIEFDTNRKIKFSKSDTQTVISASTSTALTLDSTYDVVIQRTGSAIEVWLDGTKETTITDIFINGGTAGTRFNIREQDCGNECNLYIGNNYDKTLGLNGKLAYFHIFDRALTSTEINNLNTKSGWLNNYCGNVFYNLGLVVLTHPDAVGDTLQSMKVKGTVSMTETEVYCTVGPGEFNTTHNRSIWYWNPVHNQFEVDARFQSESFRPYVTTVGLYNDSNELLAVGKLSTPIQTSAKTDTTFVLRYDS